MFRRRTKPLPVGDVGSVLDELEQAERRRRNRADWKRQGQLLRDLKINDKFPAEWCEELYGWIFTVDGEKYFVRKFNDYRAYVGKMIDGKFDYQSDPHVDFTLPTALVNEYKINRLAFAEAIAQLNAGMASTGFPI